MLTTVLVYFCLFSAFTTCALGFFVHGTNQRSRASLLFFFCMIGATYWALGEYFLWSAVTADGALFWLKASALWPIVIVATVHFILVFTENPLVRPGKSPFLLLALYTLGGLFSLIGIFTGLTHSIIPVEGGRFGYTAVSASPAYLAECVFIILIIAGGIAACISAWRNAVSIRKKKQVKYISIGIAATIMFGFLSGVLLPAIGIHLPNLTFIGVILFSLCITYAINRYGLFTLSPASAIHEILSTMPDGFILIGINERIITVNESAARTFRTDKARMQGELATRYIPEASYLELVMRIREFGTVQDFETILDPGTNTVASIAGSLVRDPEGAPAGIVLIVRDISSRKMQERTLRVANEKISLLTHLTQHDINNLVTGLSGYLLLLEEVNTTPPGRSYLSAATGLVEKISHHLRFSSEFLNLGAYQPDWQPVRLMIARAVNDLPHEGVAITSNILPLEIYADPLSFKVVYNLLENAVRHGVNLTAISISTAISNNGECLILIEDNGGGIPDADKEQIFRYGVGKHTGFGLAFARDVLEVTGITICETGTSGTGARFEIHVPARCWRNTESPVGGM